MERRGARRAPDVLDDAKIRWLDVDGIRTRDYEAGAGNPLVLIHGGEFGALYSLGDWSLNLEALATTFHVLAFDRLGQGHTDNPPGDRLTVDALLEHTRRFFELRGIRRAHVVAHSRGALVATWLAQHHPDLVGTLVIVDSRSTAPPNPEHPNAARAENTRHRQRLLAGDITHETVRAEAAVQSFRPGGLTAEHVDRMLEIARLPKTREVLLRLEAVRAGSWGPSLSRLRGQVLDDLDRQGLAMPVLVVWGADDLAAPLPMGVELFRRVAHRTPDAELHVLNRARHLCFRDRPDEFNRAVITFCAPRG